MLKEEDKIFTNLLGKEGFDLTSAIKRGDWDKTKSF
jgi:hypothetical protein